MAVACPVHAVVYNSTLCACSPGRYLVSNGSECALFEGGEWVVNSGVGSETPTFLNTVIPLDNFRRLTSSQAVLLEATLVAIVAWLLFCFALRFVRLDPRLRPLWFHIRWGISRLDLFFATRHWLEDGKVVTKRKTELGGTFSVASWILFVGLLAALLYQIITKRSIEVHRVKPANAVDLVEFVNDMEFNITLISHMTCSQLRGLDTLVTGTPGSIDYSVSPFSTFANYFCHNASNGPTISVKCNSCRIPPRNHYVSWQFVDLPNNPATAVGFQFNLTAKDHNQPRHFSYVSGSLKSDMYGSDQPKTFRGPKLNVLKIELFPQVYNHLKGLKLIQPLFHDFIPGSYFTDSSELQLSLQNPEDGLINTTLSISYLSDYIVEINKENVMSPVGILADVGGLYAVSIAIFLYLLVHCEARFKKLRHEDVIMRGIRTKTRAQKNWNKLRKYVIYTWGSANLDGNSRSRKRYRSFSVDTLHGLGSLCRKKQPSAEDVSFFDNHDTAPKITELQQAKNLDGKQKGQADVSSDGSTSKAHMDSQKDTAANDQAEIADA